MAGSYYPDTTDGRAEFWANIITKPSVFTALGFSPAKVGAIMADAAWGVFVYDTVRDQFDGLHSTIMAYCNQIANAPNGAPLPEVPTIASFPELPTPAIDAGFEKRRELWVKEVKGNAAYNPSVGQELRIIGPDDAFNPAAYKTQLLNVQSLGPKTVSGRFRKASGNADGVVIRGRKLGTTTFAELGRFTATPFNVHIPTTTTEPERWEIEAQVFKKDQPFGIPSDIVEVIVRP